MALHDSILGEFGLAPLWVRRGMSAATVDDAVTATEQGVVVIAAAVAATEPVANAAEPEVRQRPTQESPVQASPAWQGIDRKRSMQHDAAGLSAHKGTTTEYSGPQASPEVSPQALPQAPSQVPPQASSQALPEAPPQASSHALPQAPSQAPRPPLPQADAQQPIRAPQPSPPQQAPDDDFAWFDDLPSQPTAPAEARHEAPQLPPVQTLDWDALSERVAGCEQCRLCEKRTNTVFGVGDRHADWMLIGEAPGENEDRQGEPFVGQAGKLLDNMLRSLTLARDTNVYIANVIKCRPPGNRNPEPDEVARCEPYLQRQVELVKPKLIVALGRFAAQTLLKTDASISSLRGHVHAYEGVPVIVTYHPAYLLRSLPDKAKTWADLCLARDTWRAADGAVADAANAAAPSK